MKYSNYTLEILENNDVPQIILLKAFARYAFDSEDISQLADGTYNIDNGMNDVRAIFPPETNSIAFICRYERDIDKVDKLVKGFSMGWCDFCRAVRLKH